MDRYRKLCVMPEMRQAYGVTKADFESEEPEAKIRAERTCQDCPLVLGCFENTISRIMQGQDISGTRAGMSVSEIREVCTEPADDETIIRANLAAIRRDLSQQQARNHQMWQELGEASL